MNLDGNHETAVDRGDFEKDLSSLWQHSMANKTTLENFDATQKKLRDEFDQHVFTHASVKGDISQLNSEFTKSDDKLKQFLLTNTQECEKSISKAASKLGTKMQNLCEEICEFRTNMTGRLDDFINNHKAVTRNIEEIRTLKTNLAQQKKEIKEVMEDHKAFKKSEEEDNNPAGNQGLDSTRKDIESQLVSIININKKLESSKNPKHESVHQGPITKIRSRH